MSDFGLFESDEAAAHEPRLAAKTAARKMEAAIDVVRRDFGRFLVAATGIDEFGDRWHYSKADIRKAVEPYVFPNTGTMRRIHNAMKQDWKLAHPYKLAEDRDAPIQHLQETYHPSDANLIPEGNFHGYEDSVDQGGPEKVQNAFSPGGDSGSDKHAGLDREAARLVADIYTDFARVNGLRVASLDTLDAYASTGIAPADYRLLASMIVRTAECDEDCDDDSDEDSDSEAGSEAPSASESDDSDSDDDSDEAPDFGGEGGSEGDSEDSEEEDEDGDSESEDDSDDNEGEGGDDFPGGEQFTVPEHAPELDPQLQGEIPQDDPQGSAPIPPEVIDSLLGLPEGTIEQLLLEEVQKQGLGGGEPQAGPPQGGGDDFFGEGGGESEQEPPRVARRRQAGDLPQWKADGRDHDWERMPDIGRVPEGQTWIEHALGRGPSWDDPETGERHYSNRNAARAFWAADDESSSDSSGGGDSGGGGGQQSPAQDPNAMMGGGQQVDPTAMGMQQPMLPPPGSQAVQPPAPAMPLENQPAEDALLDTANQAIMQMIDRETQEYQQIIDPLSQALQAIQFAQSVEQAEHPLDVTPPQGSVDVSPAAAPGGAANPNPMHPTARRRVATSPDRKGPWTDIVYAQGDDYNEMADMGPEEMFHHMRQWDYGDDDNVRDEAPWGTNDRLHSFNDGDLEYVVSEGDGGAGLVRRPMNYQRQAKIRTALRGAARVIAQKYKLSATGERMLLEAMGRRNYEHVREALSLVPPEVRKPAAIHMGEMFAADNPRFNKDVWMRSVLASNPRDRAGDAWRDGRDRGIAEHGRHDLDDFGDDLGSAFSPGGNRRHRPGGFDPNDHDEWVDAEGWNDRTSSRGRRPFDRPRLAGETWAETPTKDAFEFPNAGKTPRVDDGIAVNNLPVMKGADPHGKNASARHASDIVKKLQNWLSQQQSRGLNYGGDVAAEGFLKEHPKLGPRGTQMVHQTVGAEPHPAAANPAPRVKAPRAVNPVTRKSRKQAGFFTRKVPGWKWDDHMNGYLSKEGRAFTCSCGESIPVPSYTNCKCGSIWNAYAVGDTHHLASDTADMFIVRSIPVRPGVVMANRKLAQPDPRVRNDLLQAVGDEITTIGEYANFYQDATDAGDDAAASALAESLHDERDHMHNFADALGEPGMGGDAGTAQMLAMIDKLADWTKYDGPDPAREGGPKKPPSTAIPKQPRDWAKRDTDGTWQGPAIPRKKK